MRAVNGILQAPKTAGSEKPESFTAACFFQVTKIMEKTACRSAVTGLFGFGGPGGYGAMPELFAFFLAGKKKGLGSWSRKNIRKLINKHWILNQVQDDNTCLKTALYIAFLLHLCYNLINRSLRTTDGVSMTMQDPYEVLAENEMCAPEDYLIFDNPVVAQEAIDRPQRRTRQIEACYAMLDLGAEFDEMPQPGEPGEQLLLIDLSFEHPNRR